MRINYTLKNIFKINRRFSPLSRNISRFAVKYIQIKVDIFLLQKPLSPQKAPEHTQQTALFYSQLKNISRNISKRFVILDIYPIFAT